MSALNVYKQKIVLKGYEKSVEIENKVASGELPVLPRSLRYSVGYAPYDSMIKKAAGILPRLNVAGLGTYLSRVMEALKHLNKPIPNYVLAAAAAASGVLVLMDMGVDRDAAVSATAELTGLSKDLIERALGGAGGAPARAGGGGAPA
jgi:hypothetical protein